MVLGSVLHTLAIVVEDRLPDLSSTSQEAYARSSGYTPSRIQPAMKQMGGGPSTIGKARHHARVEEWQGDGTAQSSSLMVQRTTANVCRSPYGYYADGIKHTHA